ncbi:MAG: hypothetical protein ABEJ66_01040 [Candidatus Nanohaloarchaea archaeon]
MSDDTQDADQDATDSKPREGDSPVSATMVMPDELAFSYKNRTVRYWEVIQVETLQDEHDDFDPDEFVEESFKQVREFLEDADADFDLSKDTEGDEVEIELSIDGADPEVAMHMVVSELLGKMVAQNPDYAMNVMQPFYGSAIQLSDQVEAEVGEPDEVEISTAEDDEE